MQTVSQLTDSELLSQTQILAAQERKITTLVLIHLREIEKRMLYAQVGYSSIFEYAVKELKYSGGAASRRVNSMRLLKEVSEVSKSIESGALNICTVSAVETFFKREKKGRGKTYTSDEKKELLQSMENKSTRECDKILATLSPLSVIPPERTQVITENLTEVRVVLNDHQMKKLEKLRGLLAHQNRDGSLAGLLELMSDLVLERVDPVKKEERIQKRAEKASSIAPTPTPDQSEIISSTKAQDSTGFATSKRKTIPTAIQRQVWIRCGSQCSFADSQTGKKCESRFALQIDHVIPVELGGNSELNNLRLLCAVHNRSEAIRILGKKRMAVSFICRQ